MVDRVEAAAGESIQAVEPQIRETANEDRVVEAQQQEPVREAEQQEESAEVFQTLGLGVNVDRLA